MIVFVQCDVSSGLRDSEASVAVRNAEGGKVFLRIERDLLTFEGDKSFLSVGVVHFDQSKNLALIELPHEADSGVNRLWVLQSDLKEVPRAREVPA